jgi:hypothetical protein
MEPFPGALIRVGQRARATVPAPRPVTVKIESAPIGKSKQPQVLEQAPGPVRGENWYVERRRIMEILPEVHGASDVEGNSQRSEPLNSLFDPKVRI